MPGVLAQDTKLIWNTLSIFHQKSSDILISFALAGNSSRGGGVVVAEKSLFPPPQHGSIFQCSWMFFLFHLNTVGLFFLFLNTVQFLFFFSIQLDLFLFLNKVDFFATFLRYLLYMLQHIGTLGKVTKLIELNGRLLKSNCPTHVTFLFL